MGNFRKPMDIPACVAPGQLLSAQKRASPPFPCPTPRLRISHRTEKSTGEIVHVWEGVTLPTNMGLCTDPSKTTFLLESREGVFPC